jgi:signal transduction histidine kinase/CheY-like chemotaxis protein
MIQESDLTSRSAACPLGDHMDEKLKKPLPRDAIREEDQEDSSNMPDFGFWQGDFVPVRLCEGQDATETIELCSLFTKEVSDSGSFDIRGGIWATTFGKVMQALPIPAFLVDTSHEVVVTNQACAKISKDYAKVQGTAFSRLFPNARMARNVKSLLEKVFLDRRPRSAEAILEIGPQRMWSRLTFRSIRIMDARFVFILLEDLTHEKRQLQLNERLRKELKRLVDERTGELLEINDKLREEIAERKRMEERLRHAAKTEAIGRLAGGIAHDFNNLLTAMIGYCNILHEKLPKDEPVQKMLGEINHAAERAATLTQQLLAFGRKQVLDVRAMNLNGVVSDMGDLLKRLIGEQIELITDLEPDLGNVSADRSQIEQIIMNLVLNARDAMPEGGTLILETRNTARNQDDVGAYGDLKPGLFAMVCVRDSGVGMDADTVSSVFDPFFTTKEKGVGTGLGLSTVLGIVEQHYGHIAVESQPGKGSMFKIFLPIVDEAEQDLLHTVEVQLAPRGQETLLVVEDEEAVRNLVCDALELNGYALLSSGDPEEALEICNTYRGTIDLILTDVVLPRMDGRSLYQRLAKTRPEMKVVFMSGYAEDAIVHHGVLDPGLHFLQKPFTINVLVAKVREVLDLSVR